METTRRGHQHAPVSEPVPTEPPMRQKTLLVRPMSVAPSTPGRAPAVQSMLTNTLVSSESIVDFKMPASLVGTLMEPDTTTLLLFSALARSHKNQFVQAALVDRSTPQVDANALADSAWSMANAKPFHLASLLNSLSMVSALALQACRLQPLVLAARLHSAASRPRLQLEANAHALLAKSSFLTHQDVKLDGLDALPTSDSTQMDSANAHQDK